MSVCAVDRVELSRGGGGGEGGYRFMSTHALTSCSAHLAQVSEEGGWGLLTMDSGSGAHIWRPELHVPIN